MPAVLLAWPVSRHDAERRRSLALGTDADLLSTASAATTLAPAPAPAEALPDAACGYRASMVCCLRSRLSASACALRAAGSPCSVVLSSHVACRGPPTPALPGAVADLMLVLLPASACVWLALMLCESEPSALRKVSLLRSGDEAGERLPPSAANCSCDSVGMVARARMRDSGVDAAAVAVASRAAARECCQRSRRAALLRCRGGW